MSSHRRCWLWALRRQPLTGTGVTVKLLLEKSANIEAKHNKDGLTPLSVVAQEGHEVIERLLIDEIDVNTEDNIVRTPPSFAVRREYYTFVMVSLNHRSAEL